MAAIDGRGAVVTKDLADVILDRIIHNAYRVELRGESHRTSVYLTNRLEQDHRGIKGRIRCMRGFKEHDAADRFCREYENSATSSGAGGVTTNTFQQPADAVTFSITPA